MAVRSIVFILLVSASSVGCGQQKATPAPATPTTSHERLRDDAASAPEEPEPTTLEQAEAALERARAELEAVAMNQRPGAAATAPPSPAEAPSRAQAAPQSEAAAEDSESKAPRASTEPKKKEASPCDTACKAYSSLVRARDAVCRLDDPSRARCSRADGIVRDASARIASCGCAP